MGQGHTLGERGGEEANTLSISAMPQHVHFMNATSATGVANTFPGSASTVMLGQASGDFLYNDPNNLVALDPRSVSNVGGSQAHINMQPFLTLSFCIALQGIFPSQN
jgi:microcystin-dependent protein